MRDGRISTTSSVCHGPEHIVKSLYSSRRMILVSVVRLYWRPRCIECPCSHRFGAYCRNHLGVDRPRRARNPRGPSVSRLPQGILRIIQDWTQCKFRPVIVDRVVFAPGNPFRQGEVEQLVKLIVRDAHAETRRDEVRVFVKRSSSSRMTSHSTTRLPSWMCTEKESPLSVTLRLIGLGPKSPFNFPFS
jgi:hypothetical protein